MRPATKTQRSALVAALKRGGFPLKELRLVHPGVSANPAGYAITGLAVRKGYPQANPGDAIVRRVQGRWRVAGTGSCCLDHLPGVPAAVLRALLAYAAKA